MIYVAIPAHDEQQTIGVLLWKVRKIMSDFGRDYEILVLDDASSDRTPEVLERYEQVLPLTVIRSEERLGQGRAIERLLEEASRRTSYPKRDVVVTLQGDFTEDPEVLVDMVKTIEGGADLVVGKADPGTLPRLARLCRWVAEVVLGRALRRAPVSDPLSDFRAYRLIVVRKALREAAPGPLVTSDGWAAQLELLSRTAPHARRIGEVPYQVRSDHRERPSRFRAWRTLRGLLPYRNLAWPVILLLTLGAPAVLAPAGELTAQDPPWAGSATSRVAPVPFGPGERTEYQVRLGPASVGEGHMTVVGLETVRGHRTYRLSMGISGGIPFARVNNNYQSWLDVGTLASRRFIQDQNEIRTRRFRHWEFFPEERRWERDDVDERGELPTDLPLDDLSFVYYVRTLPLTVGETYTLDRYFQEDGNPVVIEVLRRDRVTVPAGTFNTIVVRPIIRTRGLFSEGGEAEIHFSDDDRRLMVQMRSRVPVIGSLSLHLKSITPGRLLSAGWPSRDSLRGPDR